MKISTQYQYYMKCHDSQHEQNDKQNEKKQKTRI